MFLNRLTNCKKIKLLLSSYIDGELDGETMARVREHIKSCGDCSREYNNLLKIKRIIKKTPLIKADSNIPQAIFERIDAIEKSPEVAWFPVTIRVTLLLAIIINIGIFCLFRDYRERIPKIPSYKAVKLENVLQTEEGSVSVGFSYPFKDSTKKYKPPAIVSIKKPTYSKKLLSRKIEGTVVLNIVVDETGKVRNVKIKESLTQEADSMAISSAKTMKFKPAKLGTVKIETNITATFFFKI